MEMATIPGSSSAAILRLVLACVLGAAIGVNRELRGKPAGLRTHALVALGAALMTLIALSLTTTDQMDRYGATSRVIQGLVAGIGFIGGGVILRREQTNEVHGLSTAASIWIVSALGVATGCGLWLASTTSALLALIILWFGEKIDRNLRRSGRAAPGDEIS